MAASMAENKTLTTQKSFVQSNKRKVQIRVVFIKVEEIRTVQEEFSAIVFIRARWREPMLDSSTSRDTDRINWDSMWNPKLGVQNVKGEPKTTKWREVEFGPQNQAFVVEKRRLKGNFAEIMELQNFPFDIQDLSVLVTSDLKDEEVELVEDEHDVSVVDTHNFSDDQEWDLHNFVVSEPKELLQTEFTQFTHSKPGIYFKCCATRMAGFFIWNVMLVISVITALSLVTFAVDRSLPQNRIQLSFILVLAGVTFKFVASQSVPKISYLTHLDRYILTLMIYLSLVAVWHGVITLFDEYNDLQRRMDFWAFVAFIILYVVIVISFVLHMILAGYKRRSEIVQQEQAYLEKASAMPGNKMTKKPSRMGRFRNGLARVGFV